MPRPNILLITADQLRSDALGCYGNAVCRTPNLDALAAQSVVFDWAMTPNPICVPARACITTGNYPHVCTGHKENTGRIRPDQVKLAEHFAGCGYRTYSCGKLHYVPYARPGQPRIVHGFEHAEIAESGRWLCEVDPTGQVRGLEDYLDFLADRGWGGYSRAHGHGNNDVRPCISPLPEELHVDHWVADRGIACLRRHAQRGDGRPFLLHCGFPKPHAPLDPPHRFVSLYDPRTIPPPAGDESLLADRNPYTARERITHAQDSLSPAARQVIKAYYYALITHQDEQIGRLAAALRETGQWDSTIIVFTSDHGDLMGDFGGYFKCVFLEGSVHVPLLVRAPGAAPGRRAQLAGLQDILPTLAGLSDCPLPQAVQGLDLSPVLADSAAPGRELFYSQCLDQPRQSAMVFDGRWKYCWAQEGPTEELYDLQADPRELVNLASRESGMAREALLEPWRRKLMAEATRLGDTGIISGGRLASTLLDRASFAKLPVSGMGWRWY